MKKLCLILAFSSHLMGQIVDVNQNPLNNLYISGSVDSPTLIGPTPIIATAIFFTIDVTNTGVTISATSNFSQLNPQDIDLLNPVVGVQYPTMNTTTQLIPNPTTATLTVADATVTKTYAQILTDGGISLPFTIVANPDQTISTGYSMIIETYLQRLNLDVLSEQFLELQAFQVDGFGNGTLYHSLNNGTTQLKYWFLDESGILFSPTWSTVQFLQVVDSSKVTLPSSTTFTLTLTNQAIQDVEIGSYSTNFMVVMETYSSAIAVQQKVLDAQNQQTQITALEQLIDQIDVYLNPLNNFYVVTPEGIIVLQENRAELVAEIAAIRAAQSS